VHAEQSRALDKAGIKITVMRHGEKKARANDIEPLRDQDREDLQADIDRIGEQFVALVARNRGVERRTILDQQAAAFMGERGIDHGLADIVTSPDTALDLLQDIVS
jgi:ClpP class serine protease